ncbi:hypothetical protein GGX14DRAFT_485614 [Mycena pura]|uniref:Uncharacterized protein n=1 Tax=Mycena pura TaxID=153505 RepID=A0AAD6XX09_9AGAR|nr:hypothetical protein GGX14DRAFT_485614 [Mycena pura]
MEALMSWISFSYFLLFQSCLYFDFFSSDVSLLLIRSGRSSMFAFIVYQDATTPEIAPSSPGTGLPAVAARATLSTGRMVSRMGCGTLRVWA